MALGELIKQHRKTKKLCLQDLADKCGVSKPHLWRIEEGHQLNIKLTVAARISLTLGISLTEMAIVLLKEEENGNMETSDC